MKRNAPVGSSSAAPVRAPHHAGRRAAAEVAKLMRRNLSVIANVEQVHTLITDTAAPAPVVDELRQQGLEIILV
jgi:DeoR/GlpR family transcriptional regulator of sugar metabolism